MRATEVVNEEKVCIGCDSLKSLHLYSRSKSSANGRQSYCKECKKRMGVKARQKNIERFELEGIVVKEKYCYCCKITKDANCFGINAGTVDGLQNDCKQCYNKKVRKRDRTVEAKRRKQISKFWQRYGLSDEEFQKMAKYCEICGSTTKLVIDHDHDEGHVRGKLCQRCNYGLGWFNDDIEVMKMAISYIRERK